VFGLSQASQGTCGLIGARIFGHWLATDLSRLERPMHSRAELVGVGSAGFGKGASLAGTANHYELFITNHAPCLFRAGTWFLLRGHGSCCVCRTPALTRRNTKHAHNAAERIHIALFMSSLN
jgi:hypothetical protein